MPKKEIQAKQQMLKINIGGKPLYYYPMSEERARQIREHAKNNPPVKQCKTIEEFDELMRRIDERD